MNRYDRLRSSVLRTGAILSVGAVGLTGCSEFEEYLDKPPEPVPAISSDQHQQAVSIIDRKYHKDGTRSYRLEGFDDPTDRRILERCKPRNQAINRSTLGPYNEIIDLNGTELAGGDRDNVRCADNILRKNEFPSDEQLRISVP